MILIKNYIISNNYNFNCLFLSKIILYCLTFDYIYINQTFKSSFISFNI